MAQVMEALTLLRKDHELAEDLMARIQKEKDVEQRTSHVRAAHRRALRARADRGGDDNTPADSDSWPAKFTTLNENVEQHIQEEEGPLFEKAERLLGKKLGALGAKMAALTEAEQKALADQLDETEEAEERTRS